MFIKTIGSSIFSGKPVYKVELTIGEAIIIREDVFQGPGVALVNSWKTPRIAGKDATFARNAEMRRWVPGEGVGYAPIARLTRAWERHYKCSTQWGADQLSRLPKWDGGASGHRAYVYYDEGDYGPLAPAGWVAACTFSMSGTTYVVVREDDPMILQIVG